MNNGVPYAEFRKIKSMSDIDLAYTLNQIGEDLKQEGGTKDEWNRLRIMKQEAGNRFVNNIINGEKA